MSSPRPASRSGRPESASRSGRPESARERVVLADRRGARVVRTRAEVHEQTAVGDALVRGLVRAQLGLALRLAAVVMTVVVAIPLSGIVFPVLVTTSVFGIRLNWLVLALLCPLLYGVGWVFVRLAEQSEKDFVRVVDEEP